MPISPEMQEALDILREDHVIKSFRNLTETQKNIVERMDKWEANQNAASGGTGNSGEPASGSGNPESGNPTGNPPSGNPVPGGAPEPPPEVNPADRNPETEGKRRRRSIWWPEGTFDE